MGSYPGSQRFGFLDQFPSGASVHAARLHFCGNQLGLYDPLNFKLDYPGATVLAESIELANISGNLITNGGSGILMGYQITNVIALKNDFGSASYRGFYSFGSNSTLRSVAIVKNVANQGNAEHLKLHYADSPSFFFALSTFTNRAAASLSGLVMDPPNSAIHTYP